MGDDGVLNLTIAVPSYSAGDYPNWICYNNVRLTYYFSAEDLSAYQEQLQAMVAASEALVLPNTQKTILDEVIEQYNKEYTTAEDYEEAIGAIESAKNAAEEYVDPYARYRELRLMIQEKIIDSTDAYVNNNGGVELYNTELEMCNTQVEGATDVFAIEDAIEDLWRNGVVRGFFTGVDIDKEKGFDLTWMIQDADFSDSNYKKYWTETGDCPNAHGVVGGNNVMRYYNCNFDLSQTLPYVLPAGAYRMKVDGFERTNDPMNTAYSDYVADRSVVTGAIYLNNNEQLVMNLFDVQSVTTSSLGGEQPSGASFYVANNSNGASKYIDAGLYPNTLIAVLADDALATIGYRCANTKAWTCVDNFQLEYIGEVPTAEIAVTAGELTPVVAPFTLSTADEYVTELYQVGAVVDGEAQLYPVSTIQPGIPCVVKLTEATYKAPDRKSVV